MNFDNPVLVLIGGNAVFRSRKPNITPLKYVALQLGDCPLVSLESGPNGALIDANLYDKQGKPQGTIRDNKFTVPNTNGLTIDDRDISTLVVHDANDDELLYVRYLNQSTFRIRGKFYCPSPTLESLMVSNDEIVGYQILGNCSGDNGGADFRFR